MLTNSPLILPGDPEFAWVLGNYLPPTPLGNEACFIQRPGGTILEPVSPGEAQEYLLSGEYDDRLSELDDDDEDADEWIDDCLILPTR